MAAQFICFDLETRATTEPENRQRVVTEAFEKRPAHNTLKAEKERWDTPEAQEERMAEALDKTAVDCLLAEPVVCVWCTEARDSMNGVVFKQERDGLFDLAQQWEVIADPLTIWVGHNLCSFDLPILLNRWRRNGIKPPTHFPQWRGGRWAGRVWDTMERTPSKTPFVSLNNACLAYGLREAKRLEWHGETITGAMVKDLLAAEEWAVLIDYCMTDVEACRDLYMTQTFGGTWGTIDSRQELVGLIQEIESSGMTQAQKDRSLVMVLDNAGLIPR